MKRSEAKKPVWARNMNEEQMAVILHDDGPLAVLAQAGSGKTRALVHRMARLVETGVDEDRILAVTFSTKAAAEMNERLKKLDVTDARVGTWHSLCMQIIKQSKLPEASWEVDDTNRAQYVLKDVLGFKHMNWKGADLGQVSSFIGYCKASLFEPGSEEAMNLAGARLGHQNAKLANEAFHRFNEMLAQKGMLTFDDMLVIVARAFAANEELRARWAAKWSYVIQDEQQDENIAQDTIGEQLARDHRNYMVVGDVAQSIYGFRGARPELLAGFAERWNAKTIIMNKNYRSTKAVVDAANNIIRPAAVRIESDMQCMREEPGHALAYAADSLDDEAAVVVDSIKLRVATGDASYDDCTILFRTNAQSRALEEKLLAEKIPYVIIGGTNFYERKEVKDLLAYLRLAAGTGSVDDVKRSINTPFRFLGMAFVERVMDAVERAGTVNADWMGIVRKVAQGPGIQGRQRDSAEQWAKLVETARADINATEPMRPSKILDEVIRLTGYLDFLKRDQGEESIENSSIANVRELVRVAERFATAGELIAFIDDNIKQAKKQRKDGQSGGKRVLLMSIHRSKGLEWPHVYVVGMNEMILPHVRGDIEEERRLAYVAVTRARDTVTLTYVKKVSMASGVREVPPSRFLKDSGLIASQWGSDVESPVGAMIGGVSAALPELQPLP